MEKQFLQPHQNSSSTLSNFLLTNIYLSPVCHVIIGIIILGFVTDGLFVCLGCGLDLAPLLISPKCLSIYGKTKMGPIGTMQELGVHMLPLCVKS